MFNSNILLKDITSPIVQTESLTPTFYSRFLERTRFRVPVPINVFPDRDGVLTRIKFLEVFSKCGVEKGKTIEWCMIGSS